MLWRFFAFAAALAIVWTSVLSCGGETEEVSELTAQEYADRLRELQEASREPLESAAANMDPSSGATEAEFVQQYADLYSIGVDAVSTFFEDLDNLSPPDTVREAHIAFVAAGEAHLKARSQIKDLLDVADSWDDLDAIEGADDQRTSSEMTRACRGVEQAIRSEGVDIDLDCEVMWSMGGAAADSGTIDIVPGVRARPRDMPISPPDGWIAASKYLEFEADDDLPVTLAMAVFDGFDQTSRLSFYTFESGEWQYLADVRADDHTGTMTAEIDLNTLPPNLVVFAEE